MPRSNQRRASLLFVVPMLLTLPGRPAAAQGETGNVCVRDYQGGAVCTANDVRIEALNVVSVVEDCASGTPGETEVVFETLISADGSPNRYDIGLYLALDGGNARDGDSCYHDFLSGSLTATPTYGDKNSDTIDDLTDGPWWNGGTDGDSCGDIESNTQLFKTLPALRFACIDNNGDGSADVSVCTSWDNNTGSACNTVVDAFPGTNSKCSCSGVELGIAPDPAVTIVKSPASQEVPPSGTASFSFTVTSRTTVSAVSVTDPDCDAAPSFTGGDTNNDTFLTPDETWTYTCSKTNVMSDFMNTVTVTGTGPLGAVMDTDTADVAVTGSAVIGLAKRVTSVSDAGGGQFDVAIEMVVENLGNVALSDVGVTDDLTVTFPAPVTFSIEAGPATTGTLTANGGFDGDSDQNLLNEGASSLAVGASATITFTARITPNGADGPFSNTATAFGLGPGETPTSDLSDDGTDPDPDGDGNPDEAGENDPTPITIPENPVIGLAKRVDSVTDAGGGQFDVAIVMVVENLGDVDLSNVQVSDDLTATFPAPATFSIQAGPSAGGTLTANAGFDGSGDPNLLNAGSSTLAVGSTATIVFTVRFDPNGLPGPFSNTATASGDSPLGSTPTDASDDGADPDPNGNGDPSEPGENDPSPITIVTAPLVTATKTSSFDLSTQDNDGSGDLTAGDDLSYTVVITNDGTGDASGVSFSDAPDSNTDLVVGSVTTTQGTVTSGNGGGDTSVSVDVGTLAAGGGSVTITFEVTIVDPFPAGVQEIANQGTVSGRSFGPVVTDEPALPGPADPTVDAIASPTLIGIPTLSEGALVLLTFLVAAGAFRTLRG